jgi:hypothetical protein
MGCVGIAVSLRRVGAAAAAARPPARGPAVPADRDHLGLPLRGRPLRDRYVLRLSALDRIVHFLVLGVFAAAMFLFAVDREALSQTFYRVLDAVQGGVCGLNGQSGGGTLGELQKSFAAKTLDPMDVGLIIAEYAVLEGSKRSGCGRGDVRRSTAPSWRPLCC